MAACTVSVQGKLLQLIICIVSGLMSRLRTTDSFKEDGKQALLTGDTVWYSILSVAPIYNLLRHELVFTFSSLHLPVAMVVDDLHCIYFGVAKLLIGVWFGKEHRTKDLSIRSIVHTVYTHIIIINQKLKCGTNYKKINCGIIIYHIQKTSGPLHIYCSLVTSLDKSLIIVGSRSKISVHCICTLHSCLHVTRDSCIFKFWMSFQESR